MFFNKIKARESGVLLYGITPPKAITPPEKVAEIAEKTLNTLLALDIDALTVYDVQDESDRTAEARPFPFANSLDPFEFATQYLQRLALPKIIYRAAGKFTKEELSTWLLGLKTNGFHPVFVGLQTPDAIPITSLKDAYQIWRDNCQDSSVIGAVTIPERHAILKDEDIRILDKVESGVSFFISQCIFNVEYTRRTLDDLVNTCRQRKQECRWPPGQ